MTSEQIPPFLLDPRMIEMIDIASQVEVSVMQVMDEQGCTVTCFYQFPDDSRRILSERTGPDMFVTTKEALMAAMDVVEAECDDE